MIDHTVVLYTAGFLALLIACALMAIATQARSIYRPHLTEHTTHTEDTRA